MRTQKIGKPLGAAHVAMTLIDRGHEEEMLLERWAASDAVRSMDDSDWDESLDRFDIASVAASQDRFS